MSKYRSQYIILQITVPHNLPEFPSATSEKLDVACYACVFLLCRMKIHSALLVQLIFVCCTRPCQQSCRDGTRGGFSCQQREVRKGSFLLTAEQKQQKKKELDIQTDLCQSVGCTIVQEYTLRYYYAQKLNQTAERTEVKHQWRKTGYVLLQMVKDFV